MLYSTEALLRDLPGGVELAVLYREDLRERFQALQETLAHNRELREKARDLLQANRDLREFLRENFLNAKSRLQALEDRRLQISGLGK